MCLCGLFGDRLLLLSVLLKIEVEVKGMKWKDALSSQ